MNSPDDFLDAASQGSDAVESVHESADDSSSIPSESDASMAEYYQLQRELWFTSVILAGVIFPVVWFAYSLNVSLNYLIGASIGILYIRLLGKKVEGIGRQQSGLSNARFALIIGVIVVASQVQDLAILPIFLGFLTYKAAIIIYMLRSLALSGSE